MSPGGIRWGGSRGGGGAPPRARGPEAGGHEASARSHETSIRASPRRHASARTFFVERGGRHEQIVRHAAFPRRIVECFDVLLRAGDHARESISIAMLDVAAPSRRARHGPLHVAADDLHLVHARARAHGVIEQPFSPPFPESLKFNVFKVHHLLLKTFEGVMNIDQRAKLFIVVAPAVGNVL